MDVSDCLVIPQVRSPASSLGPVNTKLQESVKLQMGPAAVSLLRWFFSPSLSLPYT